MAEHVTHFAASEGGFALAAVASEPMPQPAEPVVSLVPRWPPDRRVPAAWPEERKARERRQVPGLQRVDRP